MVIPGWAGSHVRLLRGLARCREDLPCSVQPSCTIMYAYCLNIFDAAAAALFSFHWLVPDRFSAVRVLRSDENTSYYQNFGHYDLVPAVSTGTSVQTPTAMPKS